MICNLFGKWKTKDAKAVKMYSNIQEKKIEVQSQEFDYHMHGELVIFPAFVTLKISNPQKKYVYYQIKFYHFLQQNAIKSCKEQLFGNFFCIFTEFHIFIIHKKFIHHQLSYYNFLQQTTIKISRLEIYFYVVLQVFIMQKKYRHHQISNYLFLQQNAVKTPLLQTFILNLLVWKRLSYRKSIHLIKKPYEFYQKLYKLIGINAFFPIYFATNIYNIGKVWK